MYVHHNFVLKCILNFKPQSLKPRPYNLHPKHDAFIRVAWRICMCDMTHAYVWHDSFISVTWLVYMCDMTHSYIWHDPFTCVTWLIHTWDMTHLHVWHNRVGKVFNLEEHLFDLKGDKVVGNDKKLTQVCIEIQVLCLKQSYYICWEKITIRQHGWQRYYVLTKVCVEIQVLYELHKN